MKKSLVLLLGLLAIVGVGRALLKLPAIQDTVLERGTVLIAERGTAALPESESLRVYGKQGTDHGFITQLREQESARGSGLPFPT
jgi:hypothetical protein